MNHSTDAQLNFWQKIRFSIFIASFTIIGVVLALWFGLGWFFLMQTIRGIIIKVPVISSNVIGIVIGHEYAKEISKNQIMTGKRFFISKSSAFITLLNLALTVLFFLRANVPVIEIINSSLAS